MAEVAAGFLGPAIEVVKWVAAPILRQFKYLCCFTTNITNLKNEAQKLQGAERDLQGRVDAARNDVQLIASEVETWLQNSKEIINEEDAITKEVPKVKGGCLKLRARFSLSKRAVKTADRLKELRGECKFDIISRPRPPAATEAVPLERTYEFESRKQIEEEIMATLRGGDVNMMGICGMGGLGKTTMAKTIMNRALEEHVFEEVVMAVVSRPIDKLKIQDEIGGSLGLKLQGETSQARVQKLHARLSGPKRILLVLDDVWEKFKPEDLGIPRGYKECTILLTSRNRDVLTAMNVEKIFGMEVLSEEDSWLLFRMGAGQCVDDTKLNSIAKEVVSECAGLPIVLITVGAALKDVHVSIWENALQRLKINCTPDHIPEYIAEVYNPLKLSYDVLERKYQDVFLLCCLYPEDANIPLEQLTYFCMGLRLLEGAIGNVEAARNRIRALSKVLKSRSLLLDSKWEDEYVRMHDVVRDVCIFIAKEKGYIGDNDLTSSLQRYKLHSGFELLQIRNSDEEINFDGISDLYVLSIERCSQLTSLPFTQRPNNLITLVLDSCRRLETLFVVGELVNLEILICHNCDSIEELPPEIKGLNRLKVLYLTRCENLQRIGRGIISSLVGLEELKMLGSFKKWEGEDREERENAGLRELEALTNLRCLEIEIVGNVANEVGLTNLEKKIRYLELGECKSMKKVVTSSMDERGTTVFPSIENLLLFELPKLEEICDDRISSNSFQNLKILKLDDLPVLKQLWMSSQNDLGKDFLPQLEVLEIKYCGMMETVFLWKGEDGNENTSCHHITKIFPKLKVLELLNLPNLISLCQGIEGIEFPLLKRIRIEKCRKMKGMVWNENNSGGSSSKASIQVLFGWLKKLDTDHKSFSQLKELEIFGCHGILSLFTSSMAGNLVNLKQLEIRSCNEMVEVIKDDEEKGMSGGQSALLFPKLQELELEDLPKLLSFCELKGIESIQFPVLRSMEITKCKKMKGMVVNGLTSKENNCGGSNINAHTRLFCDSQLVLFGWLKKLNTDHNSFSQLEMLEIFGCHGILSLFTSAMAGNLVNLKQLEIRSCNEMVEVVKDDEEKGMSGGQSALLFPKLQIIRLWKLPNLLSFCELKGIESIQFPVLRSMEITKCGKMKGRVANGLTSKENNSGGSNINAHTHLFCESQLVSFGWLKKLDTDHNSFSELEELKISGCHGILSLFTASITRNLVNLKELWISKCDEMVEVIKDDEEKGMSGGQSALLFPKLHTLKLMFLPKLLSFCESKGIESIQFPVLRSMEITKCKKMKGTVANGLTSKENNSGGSNNNRQQVSFGCVKELEIDWNPFCSRTIHVSLFNGLEKLTIRKCAGSLSLFTSSMAGNLLHLKELRIEECHEMVQVIIDDEETCMSGGGQRAPLLFPKLHKIYLSKLSKLVSFCELKCDVEFPSLSEVEINGCPDITLGSLAAPNLKSFNTDLKDDLLQVPFISPKQLSVFRNEKPLNCYQIHGSVFDRLEVLQIRHYEGSMSLFSSSITGNLVNLTTLSIQYCYKMVKVIEEKEEEKEKVVSAPKLQKIELWFLHKLVRFCEWKCDVELPSLTEVEINYCRNMKSFTLGHLNTPKLESVKINWEDVGGVKDLNELVQQRYFCREEEDEEERERKKRKRKTKKKMTMVVKKKIRWWW